MTALDYIGGRNASGALCLVLGAGVLLLAAIWLWGKR